MISLVYFVFFLLILQNGLACLDGNCRVLAFPSSLFLEGERLVNHTIATIRVIDRDTCEFRCYLEHNCVSINFKVRPRGPETENCELNNSTSREHEKDLIKEANYVYYGTNNGCGNSPCKNKATCQSGFTTSRYRCLCLPGFTGHNCEHVIDKCDRNPCQNHGTCTDRKCQCQPGFSGEHCEIVIDKCDSNPCQNHGTCTDGKCQCQPGFSGEHCEIDKCDSNPCQNHGTCTDGKCQCQSGFSGEHCEIDTDECKSNRCQNSGICTDGKCQCQSGFSGEHCEIVIADQCSGSNPCQDNGNCVNGKCECLPGFSGENCEEDSDECASGVHNCRSSASCNNTVGSYTCSCDNYLTGDGTICNLASECQNYTKLTERSRKITFSSRYYHRHCDRGPSGWYRFSGEAGKKMPTSCPPTWRCGSLATGWLNGKHPAVADGQVTRKACFHWRWWWGGDCCSLSRLIKVRNCGAYYVYYLPSAPTCYLRYCSTE